MVPFSARNPTQEMTRTACEIADVLKTGIFDGVQISSPGGLQWLDEIGWKGKVALDHRVYVWNRKPMISGRNK